MSGRVQVWSLGLAVTASLVVVLGLQGIDRELCLPLALVMVALTALVAELGTLYSQARRVRPLSIPKGARLADGIVEILPIAGADGLRLSLRPEFKRFTGINGESLPLEDRRRGIEVPLLGKVALVAVFVGRHEIPWSAIEVDAAIGSLQRTGQWVEREASRSGAPVNLAVADCYFQVEDCVQEAVEVAFQGEGDDVGPLESHATTKAVAMASRAASSLGFADASDWMRTINARIDADAIAWVFLIREAGRSLAITAEQSVPEGVAFAFCYAREASFPEPLSGRARADSSTIAHELMHLFGASDKYGVPIDSFSPGTVTGGEIMRLDHDSLFRMKIDPLTAVEIGWSQFLPPRKK